ncbi:hypothetical protein [Methanoculleus sp.]|uniref:hypothetical protein n=1 Tax=Methanoculleus sp. TaxID=90427 RepID=UPI0025E52EED|nr:hypothetical protein [Methanoculleus sp.]MCK9317826.1 hypothetical protein [Methanoculleus sp.]MDD2254410.1 hypothetical protein [Methanoculleus sp.]MDD2788287.1 hypothetical protein [Methanoculleus sp.]MDD4471979.1 hypothetical protein [Methanoculleus sp.]
MSYIIPCNTGSCRCSDEQRRCPVRPEGSYEEPFFEETNQVRAEVAHAVTVAIIGEYGTSMPEEPA